MADSILFVTTAVWIRECASGSLGSMSLLLSRRLWDEEESKGRSLFLVFIGEISLECMLLRVF